jgi:acylphosphatase
VKAVSLIVHGRVQGVFFRDSTVRTARALGLSGWVGNRTDGTVSAFVQGSESAVAQMLEQMREGPPTARVERIDVIDAETEDLTSFTRR